MNVNDSFKEFKDIKFDISIEECFANLKPHPKFAGCTFDNYIPDDKYPSQHYIKNLLHETVTQIKPKKGKKIKEKKSFSFFKKSAPVQTRPKNIYIDGSFGIGKTHLLSSCYNIFEHEKIFLSFSELNYFFHYLGVEKCIEIFSQMDLLLIDEFELDDPATCLIMAKLFRELRDKTTIITTSNTLPTDLGKMKFQVDEFAKEMKDIADAFNCIVVEGEDYRKKHISKTWKRNLSDDGYLDAFSKYKPAVKAKTKVHYNDLMKALEDNHPFRYFVIPEMVEAVFIEGLRPFPQLNQALRFNQFMDHCYYYNTRLFIKGECGECKDLFSKEMMESCFQKKLLRCLSRLDELAIFYDR